LSTWAHRKASGEESDPYTGASTSAYSWFASGTDVSCSDGSGECVSATASASFAYCSSSVITDQSRTLAENHSARKTAAPHQRRISPIAAASSDERSRTVTVKTLAAPGETPPDTAGVP
jgi:hypothetical protein